MSGIMDLAFYQNDLILNLYRLFRALDFAGFACYAFFGLFDIYFITSFFKYCNRADIYTPHHTFLFTKVAFFMINYWRWHFNFVGNLLPTSATNSLSVLFNRMGILSIFFIYFSIEGYNSGENSPLNS